MRFFSKTPPEPKIIAPPAADLDAAPAVESAVEPDIEVEAPAAMETIAETIAPDLDLDAAIPVQASESEVETLETAAPETASQIEAEVSALEHSTPEAPRPLSPGAFLNGDLEIIEVLSRGQINLYRADVDEWGAHDYQLVAERLAPANPVENAPEAALFPPARRWTQDEREYAAWPLAHLTQLADWNPPANDEIYLQTLRDLAAGLAALEAAGLRARFAARRAVDRPKRSDPILRILRSNRRERARDERPRTVVGAVQSFGQKQSGARRDAEIGRRI